MKHGAVALVLFLATCRAALGSDWCWQEAAAAQQVSPILLRAIAAEESSCNPGARGRINRNGTVDHGPMQINSAWLGDKRFQRLHIQERDLYDPCKANYIAAWVIATCYKQYGVTWQAVGCYNARSPDKQLLYAQKIHRRIERYRRTGGGVC